jgi:hypothetical protein
MLSLSLVLFSRPSCCLDRAGRKVAGGSGFFDKLDDPVLSIVVREGPIGEGFTQVTGDRQREATRRFSGTYARIPMQARSRPSLWFMSFETVCRNSKIGWT